MVGGGYKMVSGVEPFFKGVFMNKRLRERSAGMVDISGKGVTARLAVASGSIVMSKKAFTLLLSSGSPKGDVFETAKVAAILAAKSTPAIIPLCHPLILNKVNIAFETDEKIPMITVIAEIRSEGKTGVEMEALTAVAAAVLTIYDMMKWADKAMVICDIKLLEKRGGKSGDFKRRL